MKKRKPIRFTLVRNKFKAKPSTKKASKRAAMALPLSPTAPQLRGWSTLPADKSCKPGVEWRMTPAPTRVRPGRYVWP